MKRISSLRGSYASTLRLFKILCGANVMGVAEGIETALSCFVASGCRLPVWSCVCANELRNFIPPRGVTDVVIFADRDCSGTGYRAAIDLKERLLATGVSPEFRDL